MEENIKSLFETIINIFNKDSIRKFKSFIKNNIWITPTIYIIGTVALILRNKTIGLPLQTLPLHQFTLIFIYSVCSFFSYTIIEDNLILIKTYSTQKNNKAFTIIKRILIVVLILIIYFLLFAFLTSDIKSAFIIIFICYLCTPFSYVFLYDQSESIVKIILIILEILTPVLAIPANIGGLKGQDVIYCKYNTDKEEHYTYYGLYDSLYQFTDKEHVILIPYDSGYIKYKRPYK